MRNNFFYLTLLTVMLIMVSSCKTREKIVYFQKGVAVEDSIAVNTSNYTPKLKKDDLLSIVVAADDPLGALPFNLPIPTGAIGGNSSYRSGATEKFGYLIDENGMINMPYIGKVKVAGLSRLEAIALIEDSLVEYTKHPIVNIQIINYKVTVLGDVVAPGTFKVPNERITLLEAIGLAGDLRITGDRKNILVIRDNEGVKTEYRIDLTSSDLFNSPVYYLEQNDVVYVEPNRTARSRSSLWVTTSTIVISVTSLILTTLSILTK